MVISSAISPSQREVRTTSGISHLHTMMSLSRGKVGGGHQIFTISPGPCTQYTTHYTPSFYTQNYATHTVPC